MGKLRSSIGISVVLTPLSRISQANHAELASRITPYGHVPMPAGIDLHRAAGLAALNGEVLRQAAAIA